MLIQHPHHIRSSSSIRLIPYVTVCLCSWPSLAIVFTDRRYLSFIFNLNFFALQILKTWVAASKPSAHAAAVKVTAAAPPPSSMPAAYASTLDRPSSASEKALIGSKTAVQAFRGGIVHSLALGKLEVLEDGLLTVSASKLSDAINTCL